MVLGTHCTAQVEVFSLTSCINVVDYDVEWVK